MIGFPDPFPVAKTSPTPFAGEMGKVRGLLQLHTFNVAEMFSLGCIFSAHPVTVLF